MSSLLYKNFSEIVNFFSSKISVKPSEVKIPMHKRILVLAPHPDDEVFGPGGTLYLANKTCKIKIIYLTSGRNITEQLIREEEANNLCDNYKFEREFLRYNQNFMELDKNIEIKIVDIVKDFRPEIVFTPFLLDDHQDHQNINRIFLKISNFSKVKVWCYQVYSSIKGNYYADITKIQIKKRKMIRFYKSENNIRNWESWVMSLNVISSRFMSRSKKERFAEMYFIFDLQFYRVLCKKFFSKSR